MPGPRSHLGWGMPDPFWGMPGPRSRQGGGGWVCPGGRWMCAREWVSAGEGVGMYTDMGPGTPTPGTDTY